MHGLADGGVDLPVALARQLHLKDVAVVRANHLEAHDGPHRLDVPDHSPEHRPLQRRLHDVEFMRAGWIRYSG